MKTKKNQYYHGDFCVLRPTRGDIWYKDCAVCADCYPIQAARKTAENKFKISHSATAKQVFFYTWRYIDPPMPGAPPVCLWCGVTQYNPPADAEIQNQSSNQRKSAYWTSTDGSPQWVEQTNNSPQWAERNQLEMADKEYQVFTVTVFNPEEGDIQVAQETVTAYDVAAARDKVVRTLDADLDLDKVRWVVRPL